MKNHFFTYFKILIKMSNIHNENKSWYQMISIKLIQDKTLSALARFVYCYMSSKPDDWSFYMEPMAKELNISSHTLRKYVKELVQSGWIVQGKQKNEHGKFGAIEYIIKSKAPTTKVLAVNSVVQNKRNVKSTTLQNIENKQTIYNTVENKQRIEYNEDFIFKKVLELWHKHCPSYARITKLSHSRQLKIQTRFKEMQANWYTLEKVFNQLEASSFLKGENQRSWKATFDWLFSNDQNWLKVYEGNYSNTTEKRNNTNNCNNDWTK